MSERASAAARRALPWLLVAPAVLFATPLSPLADDPYPHLAGAGWTVLALAPLALVVLARGAALAPAWPFALALAWALVSWIAGAPSDAFEARRALLVLAAAPLALAGGAALDARGRATFELLCVLLSLAWTLVALAGGDDGLAGVLGDTGSLSQAALGGAAIGAVWLATERGARRALGALALLAFLAHVAAAPVLAGAHTLLAGLLLGALLSRGRGRGALAALALAALVAPFVGMAARELATGASAPVEGASGAPSHSLGGLGVRGRVWAAALGLVAERPLLGAGPGQFQAAFPPHRDPREIELSRHGVCSELDTEVEHAHDDVLQAFCELGLPGGLAFALGLALAARAALRGLADPARAALCVAALALLVNALVHSPLFANPGSSALAFALLGALRADEPPGARPAGRVFGALVALPLLVAAAFASGPIRHGLALRRYVGAARELESAARADGAAAAARVSDAQAAARLAVSDALAAAPDSGPALLLACVAGAPEGLGADPLALLLDARPHSVEAWERSGTEAARAGRTEEARAAYERALALSPTHPRILRNAARLELSQGDAARGLELVERLRAGGCLDPAWLAALGEELVLELGAPARGARVLFGAELASLSPEELHARSNDGGEHAEASECVAQLLWARQNAAGGAFDVALRNYRQAAERSHARRGTEAGAAPAYVLERAAAELRAGRGDEARARVAAEGELGPRALALALEELPEWARESVRELGVAEW